MASPPLPLDVNPTLAEFGPRVTLFSVGALATVAATKSLDAVDGAPSPIEFVASTVHA